MANLTIGRIIVIILCTQVMLARSKVEIIDTAKKQN